MVATYLGFCWFVRELRRYRKSVLSSLNEIALSFQTHQQLHIDSCHGNASSVDPPAFRARQKNSSPPPTPQLHPPSGPSPSLLDTLLSPLRAAAMASGQPFASRSYAGSKLPERSANANAMPFSASSFTRHRGLGATAPAEYTGPEGPKQNQQVAPAPAAAQSHGPAQEANPLNRLTEEQREEINEAVRRHPFHHETSLPSSPSTCTAVEK